MPLFLNDCPIAICDRCSMKYPWHALVPDGNSPGLRVCQDCKDPKNPWRLPPIQPDRISLKWSRPDTELNVGIPYRDFTNPPNPTPPDSNFAYLEGQEGTGETLQEGGEGIEFEGGP